MQQINDFLKAFKSIENHTLFYKTLQFHKYGIEYTNIIFYAWNTLGAWYSYNKH